MVKSNLVSKTSVFLAETTEPRPKQEEQFLLPVYCGEDAIFNRRCATCHQRIFPEGERYLIAQSLLFHVTCFRCSICNTCCDVTNYCYVTEHEKFYCLRHYHEMVAAGNGIGDERTVVHGIGPGAFAGRIFCIDQIPRPSIFMQLTGKSNGRTASSAFLFARKCNLLARTCIINMHNLKSVRTKSSKGSYSNGSSVISYSASDGFI